MEMTKLVVFNRPDRCRSSNILQFRFRNWERIFLVVINRVRGLLYGLGLRRNAASVVPNCLEKPQL